MTEAQEGTVRGLWWDIPEWISSFVNVEEKKSMGSWEVSQKGEGV